MGKAKKKTSVHDILGQVSDLVAGRGNERDMPDGERTIPRTVAAFNAITGKDMTPVEGWLFMIILKLCRSNQGSFKEDDYLDAIGYSGLMAEEAINAVEEE